ncbi:MAG: hypothetical protein HC828_01565 [Blastochloris sp.]|nr:hypothetical protein [Blastochloris sp.]
MYAIQRAFGPGDEMTRTAAPVWVPLVYNQRLLNLADVDGETVARRTYAPLMI